MQQSILNLEQGEELTKDYTRLKKDSSGIPTLSHIQKVLDLRNNIDNCGKKLVFKCSNVECDEEQGNQYRRILKQHCMIRICKNSGCRIRRERKVAEQFDPKVNTFDDPRFLTLTLKGYHSLTRQPLDRLNYAWKKLSRLLRRRGYMRAYIKVVELVGHRVVGVDGKESLLYYWHMHVLYDGIYICADLLRQYWMKYTKDSNWIHISRVRANFSAAAYLRKYLNKLAYDDMGVDEYYKVYKMKLISSYGCEKEQETIFEISMTKTSLECPHCGSHLYPAEDETLIKDH